MTGFDMYVPDSTLAVLSGCAFIDCCKDHNHSGFPDPCLVEGGMSQWGSDIAITKALEPVTVWLATWRNDSSSYPDEWCSWALEQANRLDPTITSPPSVLDYKDQFYWY
ncbi:MAG: hypothetical protein ABFS22_02660 [Pseudomonadota bacterium]